MTITVTGIISAAVILVLVGGLVALIPVKFVIGPEIRALTATSQRDAERARAMAATTHQVLQRLEKRVDRIEQACPTCREQPAA